MTKDGWVLKLKEDVREDGMEGDFYYCDDEDSEFLIEDFLVQDLNAASIIYDKDAAIAEMKGHEEYMINKFGKDAIVNAGYTNMMKNFEWFEVEVISEE